MRLLLSIFVTMFLVVGSGHSAIDIPSQVDTFANAFATATATPNSVITLSAPITETVTVGAVNTSLTLRGTRGVLGPWLMGPQQI